MPLNLDEKICNNFMNIGVISMSKFKVQWYSIEKLLPLTSKTKIYFHKTFIFLIKN